MTNTKKGSARTPCPHEHVLRLYNASRLKDPWSSFRISMHLLSCDYCQQRLRELDDRPVFYH